MWPSSSSTLMPAGRAPDDSARAFFAALSSMLMRSISSSRVLECVSAASARVSASVTAALIAAGSGTATVVVTVAPGGAVPAPVLAAAVDSALAATAPAAVSPATAGAGAAAADSEASRAATEEDSIDGGFGGSSVSSMTALIASALCFATASSSMRVSSWISSLSSVSDAPGSACFKSRRISDMRDCTSITSSCFKSSAFCSSSSFACRSSACTRALISCRRDSSSATR
mmetsp:Transcript_9197/g.30325  ORF Transcript_9197/g.30325 Transcript_9197/m.30325 type:complete len:230 (+) Transcript_9197:1277-1966(+)